MQEEIMNSLLGMLGCVQVGEAVALALSIAQCAHAPFISWAKRTRKLTPFCAPQALLSQVPSQQA